MVNFTVLFRSAKFALIGQQSLHYFASQDVVNFRRAIIDYGVCLSPQFNASEPGHQRFLLLAAFYDRVEPRYVFMPDPA